MNPKIVLRVALIADAVLLGCPFTAFAPPPPLPPGPNLPGSVKGKIETYWIWPCVELSRNPDGTTSVIWFDEKEKVIRQSEPGWDVRENEGFLMSLDGKKVEGINEHWEFTLPGRTGAPGYDTGTRDSRIFISESCPTQEQTVEDIYVHGKHTATLGPYFRYKGREIELNEDNSPNGNDTASIVIWKDESKKTEQIISIDSAGALRLRVDCDPDSDAPVSAPDAAGVLVRDNTGGDNGNIFKWYTEKGKQHSMKINWNPGVMGWIPDTHQSLFSTSVGYDYRYRLIDWDTGKSLWDIPPPSKGYIVATGITPKYIVFATAELIKPAPRGSFPWNESDKGWIRAFYAVNVLDGSTAARWEADQPLAYTGDEHAGFFTWTGQKLYFIAEHEFTELNLDDIAAKKNGWK